MKSPAVIMSILLVSSFASAQARATPAQLSCHYVIEDCFVVNGHCFGPAPAQIPLTQALAPHGSPNDLEAEISQDIPVNGGTLSLDATGSAYKNGDGSEADGVMVKLTDSLTGVTVSSGGVSAGALYWHQNGKSESLNVTCSLK